MKRAARKTRQQGDGKLCKALDCLHGCGCQRRSLQASAVTLSVSKSASSSQHQKPALF